MRLSNGRRWIAWRDGLCCLWLQRRCHPKVEIGGLQAGHSWPCLRQMQAERKVLFYFPSFSLFTLSSVVLWVWIVWCLFVFIVLASSIVMSKAKCQKLVFCPILFSPFFFFGFFSVFYFYFWITHTRMNKIHRSSWLPSLICHHATIRCSFSFSFFFEWKTILNWP